MIASTTSIVNSNIPSSLFGQLVTFTATVTVVSPGSGVPNGVVNFEDGGSIIGSGTLNSSGIATFSTSTLSVASHVITAVYAGNSNYSISTSASITQTVTAGKYCLFVCD